jgi:hypothetical protein
MYISSDGDKGLVFSYCNRGFAIWIPALVSNSVLNDSQPSLSYSLPKVG